MVQIHLLEMKSSLAKKELRASIVSANKSAPAGFEPWTKIMSPLL